MNDAVLIDRSIITVQKLQSIFSTLFCAEHLNNCL